MIADTTAIKTGDMFIEYEYTQYMHGTKQIYAIHLVLGSDMLVDMNNNIMDGRIWLLSTFADRGYGSIGPFIRWRAGAGVLGDENWVLYGYTLT